jgi:hypothetical protein
MTTEGDGRPHPYKVTHSALTGQEIKRLHQRAAQEGRGKQFVSALRAIYERLKNDPVNFGEPIFRLPALKLIVYQAGVSPVMVDYAVHEERRLVILRVLRLLG